MGKITASLHWLNMHEALERLTELVDESVTEPVLLRLCDIGLCEVYFDAEGWRGEMELDSEDDEPPIREPVIGRGFCKAERPLQIADRTRRGIHVYGTIWAVNTARSFEKCRWFIHTKEAHPIPLFRNASIRRLAEHLNDTYAAGMGATGSSRKNDANPVLDVPVAQQQLEQAYADMRLIFTDSHADISAMQTRANQAQRMAEGEQYGNAKPSVQPDMPPNGLIFPYATKTLEAMRKAAAQYWEHHTPDKRQPTQKAIGLTIGELLGLQRQSNGLPARKAIDLASAIKPDNLPEA